LAEYNAFIGEVQIASMDLVELTGQRTAEGTPSGAEFEVGAGFAIDGTSVRYRFQGTADVVGPAQDAPDEARDDVELPEPSAGRAGNDVVPAPKDVQGDNTPSAGENGRARLGRITAVVVVTFTTSSEPDPRLVEHFGASSVPMMAHPFLREAIATTAQRLGFPGVLLPLIVHNPTGEGRPPQPPLPHP
jgi:hypothetical protein